MRYDQISPVPPLTKITKILIIVCCVGFFSEFLLSSLGVKIGEYSIIDIFGLVPAYIKRGYWWQFVTYIFLHGNVLHILLNMVILWYFGSEIEMRMGQVGFLRYFFLCGIGAGVFNYAVNILFTDPSQLTTPIIGASGAIYGILVAYGIFFGNRYFLLFFLFPMKAKYFVMIIAGVELMMGLQRGGGADNVAHFAHLGGMIVGAAYIWLLYIWPRGGKRRDRRERDKDKLRRQFKLIVNQDSEENKDDGPTYWN